MKVKIGLAALAATALVAAGCGGDDNGTATAAGNSSQTEMTDHGSMSKTSGKGASSGASELRATLTAGLQEHVYLAGIAVKMGVDNGLDSGEFKAAAATLDKNSVALAKAIGSIYGAQAEKTFLKQWRDHIGFFVDYTKGKATKDDALVKQANEGLEGYIAQFSAFLAEANPNLTAEAVANDLKGHIATLAGAVDSVVAGKADAFDQLQNAAAHMPGTAQVLADAIAKQYPDKFPS
jgi:hypothetical protein